MSLAFLDAGANIIDTDANRKATPKADFTKWPKPEDIARIAGIRGE